MPIGWVAAAGAVAGLAGSAMQADAATSAAETQANAARGNVDLMREMYAKNAPYWQPYVGLGEKGVSNIQEMLPYLTQQYPTYKPATTAEIMAQLPANYQFMKEQGLGAVRQSMNVGGGGSNMTRAATKFAEDYASNAYQNALANYMSQQQQQYNQQQGQRTGIYNTLASIAGIGQQGAAGLSNLGTGTATNIANLQTQAAQAQAAGQVGQANAIAGGLGNAASYGSLYGLSQLGQQQGAGNSSSLANISQTGAGYAGGIETGGSSMQGFYTPTYSNVSGLNLG
jgi:hypothetical protein